MSSIISLDPPTPDDPKAPPSIAPDGDMVIPYQAWLAIQDRLRKSDLFVLGLATLARERPDCVLRISMEKMMATEKEGFGIDFKPNNGFMDFTAKKPIKLEVN